MRGELCQTKERRARLSLDDVDLSIHWGSCGDGGRRECLLLLQPRSSGLGSVCGMMTWRFVVCDDPLGRKIGSVLLDMGGRTADMNEVFKGDTGLYKLSY